MKNLKLIILITFILSSIFSNAQVTVYRTFDEYKNGKGQEFDNLKNYKQIDAKIRLVLSKNNIESAIICKDIWGFMYKNSLFRVDKDNSGYSLAMVVATGKLVYYENGLAHLRMLYHETNSSSYDSFDGYAAYISKDLNSFMVPIEKASVYTHHIKVKKGIKKFKKEYPQFNDFFDCLRNYNIETVRRCIAKFEGYKDFN